MHILVKTGIMKIALCVLVLLCTTVSARAQYNLGFEILNSTGMPDGWGGNNVSQDTFPTGTTSKSFSVDSTTKYSGKYAMCINWNKGLGPWTAVNYAIKKRASGKKIKLTGYLKTENVTGNGAGLWMRLDGANRYGKLKGFDNMSDRAVKGTTDWTQYSIELDYDGSEVKQIVVGGLIVGEGKIWLDDLQVTVDGIDIAQAKPLVKNGRDSVAALGSGISSIPLSGERIKELTNLGMLWGFIKYYHDGPADGKYNMDAELFDLLPKVINAASAEEAYKEMEAWVDHFGAQPICKKCKPLVKDEDTKLMPDFGYLFDKGNLPQSLVTKLEFIKKNRVERKNLYYNSPAKFVGNPQFEHEAAYDDRPYPDAGTRLLALYRYWNMIQYFFPDKHLIGEDWNKVLGEYIPQFVNDNNALEYQLTCLSIISRIHDTHANIWGGADTLNKVRGDYYMPFQAKFIENKLVVTDYYVDTPAIKSQLKPGDIIEQVDGVAVDNLVQQYLPYTAASNYETQLRNLAMARGPLLRSSKPSSQLTIRRDDKSFTISVDRVGFFPGITEIDHDGHHTEGYKLWNKNVGYIYPGKLKDGDIKTIKELFADTKGIIIDMRCYPTAWMPFVYPDWFNAEQKHFVTFTRCDVTHPGRFVYEKGIPVGKNRSDNYKGKIVILVNSQTQSSAEYQAMALSTAQGATVIGSQTSGADGNVSEIVLPGGIKTMISGIGILYPDSTETQRKGLKIDKEVKPTIQGIKEGRDEVIEAALKIIEG
jgi:hypothetical protein